ncbi:MAG: aminotransferase class V-fold PLP-dependent enzyme [Bdellovibrionales bacterium]
MRKADFSYFHPTPQYQAGAVTDLKALIQALKGSRIWVVSDIIQGAGVRPFHFHKMGLDIACGGSHKFMCSGYGSSYMLVKKERLADLNPLEFGAMTFGTPETEKSFDRPTRTAAKKFEPGSKAMVEAIAMKSTLDLFSSVGIDAISVEACRLAELLRQGLAARDCALHSPPQEHIVNFLPPRGKSPEEMSSRLIKARISCVRRGPGIRLSPHAFNTEQDLQAVFDVIDSWTT